MNNFEDIKNELRQPIEKIGLEKYTENLLASVRPSIRMIGKKLSEDDLATCESKFGGLPDLPEGFQWPYHNEIPLSFLAQINMEQLKPHDIDNLFPPKGLLSIFYNYEEQPWGFYPNDKGCCQAFYFENIKHLSHCNKSSLPGVKRKKLVTAGIFKSLISKLKGEKEKSEEILEDLFVFNPVKITFQLEASFPGHERDAYNSINFTDEDDDIYYDLVSDVYKASDEFENRLLGFPMAVQNDQMEQECIDATMTGTAKSKKAYKENKKAANDWILLMQIDSDTRADMMWGDCGMLYLWIKKDDLINCNFDNILLFLQCY